MVRAMKRGGGGQSSAEKGENNISFEEIEQVSTEELL
jgi:hypothetical protein